MKVSTETMKTPAGEMFWIVLKDDQNEELGNLGLIDFRSPKLRREIQKDICEFLQGRQAPAPIPTEDPSRKCACGAPLKKRQRYCKQCRGKNRNATKRHYQRAFRKSYRSTVKQKTPL